MNDEKTEEAPGDYEENVEMAEGERQSQNPLNVYPTPTKSAPLGHPAQVRSWGRYHGKLRRARERC